MSIIGRLKAGIFWEKALSFAASGRYDESLHALDKAAQFLPEGIEQLLLRGQMLGGTGRYEDCIFNMEESLKIIPISNKRSEMERAYLICFARWRIREAELRLGRSSDISEPAYSEVELAKVSAHIRRKFPLREHPLWTEKAV